MKRLIAVLMLVGTAAHAEDRVAEVQRLAAQLARAAPDASEASLERARRLLEAALEGLESPSDGACMQLATEVYGRTQDRVSARSSALGACSESPDMDVVAVALRVYQRVYDSRAALERSLALGTADDLRGRSELLQLALSVWSRVYDSTGALDRAVEAVRGVPPRSIGCVREGLRTYSEQLETTAALTRALEECR